MAVDFLKNRVGEGRGVVDGLSLAIQAPSTDESKSRAAGNRVSPGAVNGVLAVADDGRGMADDAEVDEVKGGTCADGNSWDEREIVDWRKTLSDVLLITHTTINRFHLSIHPPPLLQPSTLSSFLSSLANLLLQLRQLSRAHDPAEGMFCARFVQHLVLAGNDS